MKKLYILFTLFNLCLANITTAKKTTPLEPVSGLNRSAMTAPGTFQKRNIIATVGDSRSLLGPAGKNICVCSHGDVIAVMYGPPSDPYDANQPFNGVYVAYSTDSGATWNHYGPHNQVSPLRRIYPAVDGCDNFCTESGNLFFVWQEGQVGYDPTNVFAMVDENIPALPSFSPPTMLPGDIDGWMPCIGVNPDDNSHVMITAWSYLLDGNRANYAWLSTDGGYTWTDTIRITPEINPSCNVGAGHFRWGTGDYAFFTYHDTYMDANQYPHYVETTDGGYTWSKPAVLPAITSAQFWWHELDCEVVNSRPFAVHNDIGESGIMQLFYPDPMDPGSPGNWNWTVLDVTAVGSGDFSHAGTTWTISVIQYPSISSYCIYSYEVIVVSYKANFEINPPPAGWTDGNYLGGILSFDGGDSWEPCRPMSGPLFQAVGGPVEVAHRLLPVEFDAEIPR
jgi:hypothetical protein